jgi:cytidine deaminase
MTPEELPPELRELVTAARAVREHAHAPYSKFRVGAAVRSASSRVFAGCNVENASFGATLCAERSAIAQLVSAGESRVIELAVFTDASDLVLPCGVCRQVISEFGSDLRVAVANPRSARVLAFRELFPEPFSLEL